MRANVAAMAIAVILASTTVRAEGQGQNPADDTLGGSYVEARYRALGEGFFQASADVRFRTPKDTEVGWRVAWADYHQKDPTAVDRHLTFGPVWAFSAPLVGGRLHLRLGVEPWLGVWTPRRSSKAETDMTIRYGGDASAMLHTVADLGRGLRLYPGVGLAARGVRTEDAAAQKVKAWDSRAAWRFALPMWIGERRRLRVECAYSLPFRSGTYLPDEGWDLSAAWAF
jgi:hypothetical protein